MRDFTLICDDILDETILNIATNLPNLKTLALFKTTETKFPNKFMSLLIQNLQNLEELTIGNEEVDDEVAESEDVNIDEEKDAAVYDISNLSKLKAIDIFYVKNCPELSFQYLHRIPTLEVIEYTNAFVQPVRYIVLLFFLVLFLKV